jgi:hypothetical protein
MADFGLGGKSVRAQMQTTGVDEAVYTFQGYARGSAVELDADHVISLDGRHFCLKGQA